MNGNDDSGKVQLQGMELSIQYLGPTLQSSGKHGRELTRRDLAGWTGWRRVTGVI